MSGIHERFQGGLSLHRRGELAEAEIIYREILKESPRHSAAMQFLGVLHLQRRDFPVAIALLRRALAIDPRNAAAHANLGSALLESGEPGAAVVAFDAALEIEPARAGFLDGRGKALLAMDRAGEALRDFRGAVALDPKSQHYYCHAGEALMRLGRATEALRDFATAAELAPQDPAVLNNRGNALLALRRPKEALADCQTALARSPRLVEAIHNCGCAFLDMDRPAEARVCFEQVLALTPDYVKSMFNLGVSLRILREHEAAAQCFRRVLELSPRHAHALGAWMLSLRWACAWRDLPALDSRLRRALETGNSAADPRELLALTDSPELQYAHARSFIRAAFGPGNGRSADTRIGTPRRAGRLVLAYVSSDFHEHATAHLMAELFETHDRARFEVLALSAGPDDGSPMRRRLEGAFDRFIDVRDVPDDRIADIARREGVHIAVDLKGLTLANRIGAFARRCAPLQVAYLGYPGTCGAEFIDYLIADRIVIPEDQQRWYTEKIVYLPDCYQVNDTRRELAATPLTRAEVGLPEGAFVFCCFNASFKISPPLFDIWIRLLLRVPSSVLWLLHDNETAVQNLRRETRSRGVDPGRILFAPRIAPAPHIARYRLADLFLDTLPYGAHTTASEALWAGLPVLTCRGETFAGRVGASLLTAIGLPDLIAPDLEEYESSALALALQPATLRDCRQRLVRNRSTHPLFNLERFRRHLEQAYESMWERHEAGLDPASIAVPPAA